MTCWELLQIDPTIDERRIKRAYALLLRTYHPEDDPQGFQSLREAFEKALAESKYLAVAADGAAIDNHSVPHANEAHNAGTEATPSASKAAADPPKTGVVQTEHAIEEDDKACASTSEEIAHRSMQMVVAVYGDVSERKKPLQWQSLLERPATWPIDAKLIFGFHLFAFLGNNPWIPPAVWAFAEEQFSWQAHQSELYKHFPEDLVDHNIWRIHNWRWLLGIDDLPCLPGADYDRYLHHREEAYHFLMRADLDGGRKHLSMAAGLLSGDPQLARLDIVAHLQAGEIDHALEKSAALAQSHPDYDDGLLLRAQLLLKTVEYGAALKTFQQLLRNNPDCETCLTGLARCHMAMGNFLEAQHLLVEVLARQPDHLEAQMEMLRVGHLLSASLSPLVERADVDEKSRLRLADAYLLAGMPEQAAQALAPLFRAQAGSDVYLLNARIFDSLGQPERALESFEMARRAAQDAGENPYRVLLQRGIFHFNNDAYEQAIEDLELVRQSLGPSVDPQVWRYLGEAYRLMGNYSVAIDLFNELIKVDDSEMTYFLNRGFTLFDLEQYEAALQDFQTCLQRDYYSSVRHWIGKCYTELKDFDAAQRVLEEAATFGIYLGEVAFYRAKCSFLQQDYPRALEHIRDALAKGSQDILSHLLAANIHRALNDPDQALTHFKASLQISENKTYFAGIIANYCAEIRRWPEAIDTLEAALESGGDPELLLTLADITYALAKPKISFRYMKTYFNEMEKRGKAPKALAYLLRGRAAYVGFRRHPKKCLQDLHAACDGEDCEAAPYYLGMAYFDLKKISEAEKYARRAVAKEPTHKDFQTLARGIEKYQKAGWFTKQFITSKAIHLWPPVQREPWYTISEMPPLWN